MTLFIITGFVNKNQDVLD